MKVSTQILSSVVTIAAAGSAYGQIDDGRALDANPMVGADGYNAPVLNFVPNSSDLIVTGNVSSGRAFRGFSPIDDPSALRLSSPLSTLGNFRRDSFGLGNLRSTMYDPMPQPYFLPERTTTSLDSVQRGVNLPGSSYGQSTFIVPRQDLSLPYYSQRIGAGGTSMVPELPFLSLPQLGLGSTPLPDQAPILTPGDPGRPVLDIGPIGPIRPMVSYGQAPSPSGTTARVAPTPSSTPPHGVSSGTANLRLPYEEMATRSATMVSPTLPADPLARPMMGTTEPVNSTTHVTTSYIDRGVPVTREPATADTADLLAGEPSPSPRDNSTVVVDGSDAAASEEPMPFEADGVNPYEDLQAAWQWLEAFQTAAEDEEFDESTHAASLDRAKWVLGQTLESYAGKVTSLAGDYIRQAEEALRTGDSRRAVTMYRLAITLDPMNPLLDLGLGHAYLGLGDFQSAVLSLVRGIERFPGIAYFRIDLSKFLTDPTLLDRRRAELEKELARQEDYRLRFLLGYAEYYSGLPQFGIENLRRAAELAPPDSTIARFPELLTNKSELRIASPP